MKRQQGLSTALSTTDITESLTKGIMEYLEGCSFIAVIHKSYYKASEQEVINVSFAEKGKLDVAL